jgi:hypothetical protein
LKFIPGKYRLRGDGCVRLLRASVGLTFWCVGTGNPTLLLDLRGEVIAGKVVLVREGSLQLQDVDALGSDAFVIWSRS